MSVVVRVSLLLAAVVLILPAPAAARVVACGEVITVDTRVDNDLVCPTPAALEIGANGVDLDLGGHTIEAVRFVDENGSTNEEGDALVVPGYDDVSVTNGTLIGVDSLGIGLLAYEAERLSLRRLSLSGYGSFSITGDGARIVDVIARGFAAGIQSSGATIDKLTTHTEFDVYGQAVEVTNSDFRISAGFHLDGSSLRRNVFGSAEWSISGNANSILNNQGGRASFSGGGGNIVRGNRIAHGLVLHAGFSGNLIRDNIVSGNPGGFFPEFDAIFVAAGAADNVLVANSAFGSSDDGIDVEEPSTTLARNRAFGNADLGIEAVAGVIDGGGNRAWDNGNPLQCLNVDCG
jgi:hypothetical protein